MRLFFVTLPCTLAVALGVAVNLGEAVLALIFAGPVAALLALAVLA